MNVPTIPTARIAILIASFALILTIVLLLVPGDFVSLLGPSVASDLSNASWVPNPTEGSDACKAGSFPQKLGIKQFPSPGDP